jgi:hypothetical protein
MLEGAVKTKSRKMDWTNGIGEITILSSKMSDKVIAEI